MNKNMNSLIPCEYCEGKGYDIFNKEELCPFCNNLPKTIIDELTMEKIQMDWQIDCML